MNYMLRDRVWERTTSTGPGDLNLAGAPDAEWSTFADAFGGNAETDVAIYGQGAFEVRRVQFVYATNRIVRSGRLYRSSTGSTIDFGAGEKQVIVGVPAVLIDWLLARASDQSVQPHILSAVHAALGIMTV